MKNITIDDCIKLYEQGVKVVVNDGKIKEFITPNKEHIKADMFLLYFVEAER